MIKENEEQGIYEESVNGDRVIDLNSSFDGFQTQPVVGEEVSVVGGVPVVGDDDTDDQFASMTGKDVSLSRDMSDSNVDPPAVGMVFSSWEAVDEYYQRYGQQQGFSVVRHSTSYKRKGGKNTDQKRCSLWRCACFGKPVKRRKVNGKRIVVKSPADKSPTLKTITSKKCECPAMLYAAVTPSNEWELKRVVLEHENHNPTPTKSRHISKYRQQELKKCNVARSLFNANAAGVPISQIHKTLAMERNGLANTSFTERDVRNTLDKKRRLEMQGGDANAMLDYFHKMVADNKNFQHFYRLDDDGNLKDVMWVDARCQAAYEEFGDVVSFDSTYLTNKSELPFTNFVGVNHHGQTILFGCALVSHEDVDTFSWLFSTWLKCMRGKAPVGMLTDQDATMRKAMSLVMPETRHRWCMWHILKKFSEKLGMYSNYKEIKSALHSVIYDSFTEEEFEVNWMSVIMAYNLEGHGWLSDMYAEREMWIPAFMKDMFWAGMRTTQRSESIHAFFDGYVSKTTRLFEFPRQHCYALEVRANEEKEADAKCWKNRSLMTAFPLESQFRDVYTDAKFKEVQVQCTRVMYLTPVEKRTSADDADVVEHLFEDIVYVRNKKTNKEVATTRRRTYCVEFNINTLECICECKHFDTHGIMCRHQIKVFFMYNIADLPANFILRRWRKDVQRKHMVVKVGYHDPNKTIQVKRFDKLMAAFEPICVKASLLDVNIDTCLELLQLMNVRIDDNNNKFYESAREGTDPSQPTTGEATPNSISAKLSCNNSSHPHSDASLCHTPNESTPCQGSTTDVLVSKGMSINGSAAPNASPISVGDPLLWRKKKGPTGNGRLQSAAEKAVNKKQKKNVNQPVDANRNKNQLLRNGHTQDNQSAFHQPRLVPRQLFSNVAEQPNNSFPQTQFSNQPQVTNQPQLYQMFPFQPPQMCSNQPLPTQRTAHNQLFSDQPGFPNQTHRLFPLIHGSYYNPNFITQIPNGQVYNNKNDVRCQQRTEGGDVRWQYNTH